LKGNLGKKGIHIFLKDLNKTNITIPVDLTMYFIV